MHSSTNLAERTPVWVALSDLYLDTETQDFTFRYIARTLRASPYSLAEARRIDQYEMFPVLYSNRLSVAGVWDGFQEAWLINTIVLFLTGERTSTGCFTMWYTLCYGG